MLHVSPPDHPKNNTQSPCWFFQEIHSCQTLVTLEKLTLALVVLQEEAYITE
jgi:hypothetical protein